MEKYKRCKNCRQLLSLVFFSLSKGKPRSKCKPCRAEEQRLRYARNPEYNKNYNRVNKERQRPIIQAWLKKNKAKRRLQERARVAKNPEKYLAKARAHRQNNRSKYINYYHSRRDRLLALGEYRVTSKELDSLLRKPCFYCGKKSETIDHIIPVSRGGRHAIGNLTGSCKKCNFSKNNKFLIEWIVYKKQIESINAQRPRPSESP